MAKNPIGIWWRRQTRGSKWNEPSYETSGSTTRATGSSLLTLNRPEVANAMNTQMGIDLLVGVRRLSMPTPRRAVAASSDRRRRQRIFCAGGDLKERNGMTDQQWQDQHLIFERAIRAVRRLPGAGDRRGERRRVRRRAGDRAVLRLHLRRRARALRADRGDAGHHAGRRRHAEPAARGRRAAGQGDPADRPAVFRRSRRSNGAWSTGSARADALLPEALETARAIADNAPISMRQIKQSVNYGLKMDLRQRHDVRDRGL